jgi:hypothetical protein
MANFTTRQLKFAILKAFTSSPRGHRFNMLGGRGGSRGGIEYQLNADFEPVDRQQADFAFGDLVRAGMIRCTFSDMAATGDWFEITDSGRAALRRQTLDDLDEALLKIGPQLVELREGAWSALASGQPDAARQAAHSARELIDQVLKEGAADDAVKTATWFKPDSSSKTGVTRRHRLRYVMEMNIGQISDTDLTEAEAACDLVHASATRLMALSHSRAIVSDLDDVRGTIQVAETALRRILVPRSQ